MIRPKIEDNYELKVVSLKDYEELEKYSYLLEEQREAHRLKANKYENMLIDMISQALVPSYIIMRIKQALK